MRKNNKQLLALSLGVALTSQNLMIVANAEESSIALENELNALLNNNSQETDTVTDESQVELVDIDSTEDISETEAYQPDPEENQTYSMGGYASKAASTDLEMSTLSTKSIGNGNVTTDNLNVRSGPSTSNEAIGTLKLNDTVDVTGRSGNWYKINFDGKSGYISATYLSLNPIQKGIDVSKWNGNIDWNKVKADGIDYVIIRAGYGSSTVDPNFKTYIEGARDAGLKIGVYWFSYATSTVKAEIEAQKCLETIAPYKNSISYPVFFDYEYDSVSYASKQGITITKSLASEMANVFLGKVESAGYVSGLYTNKDFSNNYFSTDLIYSNNVWVAQYSSTNSFNKPYSMWQYSEKGSVSGISGYVDMNYTCLETFDLGINHGNDNSTDDDNNTDNQPGDDNNDTTTPDATKEYGVTTSNLNFRTGASTTATLISTIPKDTKVEIIDKSTSGWYKINYDGQTGYVSSQYIALENNDDNNNDNTTTPAPPVVTTEKGVTTANLNMRKSASTSASIITTIAKGSTIEIVDKSTSGWYKITYNGQTGYVSSEYVTLEGDNSNDTPAPPAVTTEKGVTTANLNMRKSASTSASIITTIAKGATIEIVDKSTSGWYKITYNGQTGYVSSSYVSINGSNDNTTTPTPPAVTTEKGVTTANLNMRKSASTSASIITTIAKGAAIEIVDKSTSGWYKITYNGQTGYVSSSYVSINGTTTNTTTYGTTTANLNFRKTASTSGLIISTIKKGSKVEIVSKSTTGWYKVKYNGVTGYVSSQYVQL